MDVLIQGVGWLLVVTTIAVSARQFYRQRAAVEADRQVDRSQRESEERRGVERELRQRVVFSIEELLSQVTDHLWDVERQLRIIAASDKSEEPGASHRGAALLEYHKAAGAYADVMSKLAFIPIKTAFDARLTKGPLETARKALGDWYDGADKARQRAESQAVPESWISQIDAHASAVLYVLLNFRHALAQWLTDGTIRSIQPVPDSRRFTVEDAEDPHSSEEQGSSA
jgi:hypothetical protein